MCVNPSFLILVIQIKGLKLMLERQNVLRAIFQANEYKQKFQSSVDYLDPFPHGFDEHKGGLRPILIMNSQSECQQ